MKSVFDEIKDRLPITEVLATYITLIPSGSQLKAKCPFHTERSASFSISPDRGLYYCFGCGAKGDIFTFVEQFEGVDRKGALKILADRAGVVLTRDHVQRESTDPVYDVLESVTTRYQQELERHPEVQEYLTSRGITRATINTFRIGYVPDEWRFIANTMTTESDTLIAERAGLIKKTERGPASTREDSKRGEYYDRFRKRVMFPLMDSSGRVVGFSGRLFPVDTHDAGQSPKYLNSPETELFQKSRILFAFDKAKAAIRQHNFAILVEGQVDCVLAHQAGFKNTVATSGTAVSDAAAKDATANLAVLARLTPNVFLAFDGDAAGQKALDRAAIVALTLGMNPKVVPLPEGIDPAEYIMAHGAEGWKALLKDSRHFILHQLKNINQQKLSAHALVKALHERIFPFLTLVQSPIEQSSYIEAIAKELDITKSDVVHELARFKTQEKEVLSIVTRTPETISLQERFLVLSQRYPNEKKIAHKSALENLAFDEQIFTFMTLDENRIPQLFALVEREYGHLTEEERDQITSELALKLKNHFYASLSTTYTRALKDAEAAGDEVLLDALMTKLHTTQSTSSQYFVTMLIDIQFIKL